MDLTFSPEQQAFRAELRGWFAANRWRAPLVPPYTDRGLRQHLNWEHALFDAGYAAPGWPREVGGLGCDMWEQLIYDEEYARAGLPERINKMGLVHGGPTVLAHGTDEQRDRWLPRILRCTDIWCQGFSEPEAGSDLAALRTTGRVEGDALVVNGQKTWTTQGIIATTMFALVRTDPQASRHRGISFVVIDLDAPGVEVRPLRQLHGHPGFAEVFFTDVEVPLTNVVGALGDGWRVARTSLQLERGTARGTHARLELSVAELARAVRDSGAEPGAVQRLGRLRAWTYAYAQAAYAATDLGADTAFSSMLKLSWSRTQTAVHEAHLAALGPTAELVDSADELTGVCRDYWHGRAAEIFAGSTEIQLSLVAEQGLGLPREPRA